MKIGYFVSHFLYKDRLNRAKYEKEYAHGGTEIAAYNLAVQMRRKGHKIDVFTTAIDGRNAVEEDSSITIHRYGTNFRIASANFAWGLIQGPQKVNVDIVHAHYNTPYADYSAMKYSKKKKVPLVLTYHADAPDTGGSFLRNRLQAFYNRRILPRVLNQAYIIIATSQSYIEQSKFLGNYRQKIKVIPNGINLEEFQINISKEKCREKLGLALDKTIVIFFGNLVQYKGPNVLLRAFANIKKGYPDVQLIFAGRGPMHHELISLAKKLGVEQGISFTGYVEEELKPLYYKSADIFCLPSVNLTEAFGIVNLEAMACGLPIVASNLGGIPDLVKEGENGLLFDSGNVKELSNKLEYLLDNKNLRRNMGEKGEKLAADYSWIKIAEKTEAVYKSLSS
jgi:glycosyltransferase involved in cell wall biosynthesis